MAEETKTDTEQHDNTDASGDKTLLTPGEEAATTEGETLLTDKKEEATVTPETYADFDLPEGYSLSDDFVEYAKTQQLTQEQAQSVLERSIASEKDSIAAFEAQQAEDLQALKQGWLDETMADKELGGDNQKEVLAGAKQVVDQFGSKGLNALFDQSGLGNHPEMIRLLHSISKVVSEDTFINGSQRPGQQKTTAQIMFPNSQMN